MSLSDGFVRVDERQATTIDDVFCAGEPTGIGGVELSLVEGEIAGRAATGSPISELPIARRGTLRRYAQRLAAAFSLRPDLLTLAKPDTIVCRCEDVRLGDLDAAWSSRQAKLYTRAGMGPCQGRICGAALESMLGWTADSVRPPVQPTRLATMLGEPTIPLSVRTRSVSTMQQRDWQGVFPAITTPFLDDLSIDHARLSKHVAWLADTGCRGIVALGSLGEAQTLGFDEKISILETCKRALGDRIPLIAGIAGLSTAECVALAKRAAAAGAEGLMVLPPYVYKGDWRESKAHFEAVIGATSLSCMLYNNPIAYGTDVSPTQMRELSRNANLHAVKESSGDVRRVTAVREVNGDRLVIFAGMDDMIVESVPMGASGWVAGLVNALPGRIGRGIRGSARGAMGGCAGSVRVVPPPTAAGHRAEVRAVDQARSGGDGAGQRRRASAAARVGGR